VINLAFAEWVVRRRFNRRWLHVAVGVVVQQRQRQANTRIAAMKGCGPNDSHSLGVASHQEAAQRVCCASG